MLPYWKGHCVPRQGCFLLFQVRSSAWIGFSAVFLTVLQIIKGGQLIHLQVCFRKCVLKMQAVLFFFESVLHHMLTSQPLSQGNVTRQVPICCGSDPMPDSACWWHRALTLCLEQRLRSDPARCWRLLRCHMQTSRVLRWGAWKPVQDPRVLFLVNLLSPRLAHQTKVLTACCWTTGADQCFGSGQSGWGAYLESGSVWLEHTCSSWEPQSGCSLSCTYTNHPHLAHLLPQAAYLTASLSPGVPSWAFSELDGQFQLSRDPHNEFMASTSAVVLLMSMSAYSGYPVTKLSKVLLGREFCFLHV